MYILNYLAACYPPIFVFVSLKPLVFFGVNAVFTISRHNISYGVSGHEAFVVVA